MNPTQSKSIWVIEQGEYSDYHVVGIFSSKENAEKVLSIIEPSYDPPKIVEYKLDPGVEELNQGLTPYSVLMEANGDTVHVEKYLVYDFNSTPKFSILRTIKRILAIVFATSETHAVKIVNERRIQMIANGELK